MDEFPPLQPPQESMEREPQADQLPAAAAKKKKKSKTRYKPLSDIEARHEPQATAPAAAENRWGSPQTSQRATDAAPRLRLRLSQPERRYPAGDSYSDFNERDLSALVERIRSDFHRQHGVVCIEKVVQRLCEQVGVENLNEIQFSGKRGSIANIKALRALKKRVEQVQEAIVIYVATRLIATIHDVERHLCSQLNVAEFSHLVVGVIEKQPQVVRFFQLPPSMSNVVEITDVEVMEFIRTMRMRSRGGHITNAELVDHISKVKKVPPLHLGIHLQKWTIGTVVKRCSALKREETEILRNWEAEERKRMICQLEAEYSDEQQSNRTLAERGDVMSPAAKRFLGGLQHLSRQPRGMVLKQLQTQLKVAKGDTVPLANDTLAQIRHLKKTVAFIPGPDRSRPLEPASSSPSACRQDNRPAMPTDILDEVYDSLCALERDMRQMKSWATNLDSGPKAAIADILCTLVFSGMNYSLVHKQAQQWASLTEGDIMTIVSQCSGEVMSQHGAPGDPLSVIKVLSELEGAIAKQYEVDDFSHISHETILQLLAKQPAAPPWLRDLLALCSPSRSDGYGAHDSSMGGSSQRQSVRVSERTVDDAITSCWTAERRSPIKKPRDTLTLLSELEAAVTEALQLGDFQEGAGRPFLAYLAEAREQGRLPILTSTLTASLGSGATGLPTANDVARVVRQAEGAATTARSGRLDESALERAVCQAFGATKLADLGLGESIEEVRNNIGDATNIAEGDAWFSAAALFPDNALAAQEFDAEFARSCCLAAPPLMDLHKHLHWDRAFAPLLGDLRPFLRESCASLAFLEEPAGRKLVKIDLAASLDSLPSAMKAADGRAAASCLVAVLVRAGGVAGAPQAMIKAKINEGFIMAEGDSVDVGALSLSIIDAAPPWSRLRSILAEFVLPPLHQRPKWQASLLEADSCQSYRALMRQLALNHDADASLDLWRDDLLRFLRGDARPSVLPRPRETTRSRLAAPSDKAMPDGLKEDNTASTCNENEGAGGIDTICNTPGGGSGESVTEDEARSIVNSIRKNLQGGNGSAKEMLSRALERLSRDLYSEATHFVLELVQNADDNSYRPGVEPTLNFCLTEQQITVTNNEVGFTRENVLALCDVGRSSKGHGGGGYIGQKGIGFKSVFAVSRKPEIHSGGFHFSLDRSNMVLPEWIAASDAPRAETTIRLPLDPETSVNKLSDRFCDIQPELLLFLNKLRRVKVISALASEDGQAEVRDLRRQDKPNNLVELIDDGKTSTWLVMRKTLDVGSSVTRGDATKTTVSMAFPFQREEDGTEHNRFPVFSYLPVTEYGFRFVVQADFILPSSREAVQAGDPWNEWLRDSLPDVFVAAVDWARTDSSAAASADVDSSLPMSQLLDMLPTPGEIRGFFRPVAEPICRKVRTQQCVPTAKGEWVLPVTALLCDNVPEVQTLVPQDLLLAATGLVYVADSFVITKRAADAIGLQQMGCNHLLGVLQFLCGSTGPEAVLLQEQHLTPAWVGRLLVSLKRCPGFEGIRRGVFQEIPLVPLAGGVFTRMSDGAVYFPATSKDQQLEKVMDVLAPFSRVLDDAVFQVEGTDAGQDALIIRSVLSNSLGVQPLPKNNLVEGLILPLFEDPSTLDSEREYDVIVVCIKLLIQVQDSLTSSVRERLAASLRLPCLRVKKHDKELTADTTCLVAGKHCHLYQPPPVLRTRVRQLGYHVVDIDTLSRPVDGISSPQSGSPSHQRCLRLLRSLGVPEFVSISETYEHVPRASTPWGRSEWDEHWKELGGSSDALMHTRDFQSADLQGFLNRFSHRGEPLPFGVEVTLEEWRYASALQTALLASPGWKAVGKALEATASNQKSSKFDKSMVPTAVYASAPNAKTVRFPSSLLALLGGTAWVPVKGPEASGETRRLSWPCHAFLKTEETKRLGGSHALFVADELRHLQFTDGDWARLGVRNTIDTPSMLLLLREWSTDSIANKGIFKTSLKHMRSVYSFLHQRIRETPGADLEQVQSAFQEHPLVWVPDYDAKRTANSDQTQRGRFIHLEDTAWEDPSEALDANGAPIRALAWYYGNLRDFFCRKLCNRCLRPAFDARGHPNCKKCTQTGICRGLPLALVPRMPKVDAYIQFVQSLALSHPESPPQPSVLEAATKVLAIVSGGALLPTIPENILGILPKWLRRNPVFPSSDGFLAISPGCVYSDNEEVARLFSDEPELQLLRLHCANLDESFGNPEKALKLLDENELGAAVLGYTNQLTSFDEESLIKKAARIVCTLRPLLPYLHLPLLTDIHRETVNPTSTRFHDNAFSQTVRQCVPLVQRYLTPLCLAPQLDGWREALVSLKVCLTSDITVMHEIHLPQPAKVFRRTQTVDVYLNHSELILYVSPRLDAEKIASHKIVWAEFLQLFCLSASEAKHMLERMELFVRRVQQGDTNEDAFSDAPDLPDHVAPWFVPVPKLEGDGTGVVVGDDPGPEVLRDTVQARETKRSQKKPIAAGEQDVQWPPNAPIIPPTEIVAGGSVSRAPLVTRLHEDPTVVVKHPDAPRAANGRQGGTATALAGTFGSVAHVDVKLDTTAPGSAAGERQAAAPTNETVASRTHAEHGGIQEARPSLAMTPSEGTAPNAAAFNSHLSLADVGAFVHMTSFVPGAIAAGSAATGRLGEEVAFRAIAATTSPQFYGLPGLGPEGPRNATWVNADKETELPYDITYDGTGPDGERRTFYVEVKSTAEDAKAIFEVSAAELEFAQRHSECYVIFRLFGLRSAGTGPPLPVKVAVVAHPWRAVKEKCAQLYLGLRPTEQRPP